MAEKSSKRAREAAKRGDAGIFDRIRNTKIGSEVLEPTMNAYGKSSELQASRIIDRRKRDESGRLVRPNKTAAGTDASKDRYLRGAKPNPLPTGAMEAMSQLSADRSRERRGAEETGMAADLFADSEEAPLLSLPTRSYARPEETSEETEHTRQQGMQRTMRQFIGAGAVNEERSAEGGEEAPQTRERGAREDTETASFQPTGEEGAAAEEALAQAAALDDARRRDEQAARQRSAAFAGTAAAAAASSGKEAIQRMARLRIRAMIASGVAGFKAVFPLLGAALLSMAWMLDSRFMKRLPPPKAPDYATGGTFCCVCSCGCIVAIALLVLPFALLANADYLDLLSWGLQALWGLF